MANPVFDYLKMCVSLKIRQEKKPEETWKKPGKYLEKTGKTWNLTTKKARTPCIYPGRQKVYHISPLLEAIYATQEIRRHNSKAGTARHKSLTVHEEAREMCQGITLQTRLY